MKFIQYLLSIIFIISILNGCSKQVPKQNMAQIHAKEIQDRANKAWNELK